MNNIPNSGINENRNNLNYLISQIIDNQNIIINDYNSIVLRIHELVEFRKTATHLQWRYKDDTTWYDLVLLSDIKGPIGDTGPQGDPFVYADFTPQQLLDLTGPTGPQGPIGLQGPVGPQGIQGEGGSQGPAGPQGLKGDKGDTGLQGLVGPEGPEGPQGPQGIQGIEGPEGPQGIQGIQGIQGPIGPEGPQGPAGNNGLDGDDGIGITSIILTDTQGLVDTYTITFTDNSTFDYDVTNGADGAEGPEGTQGPQGIQGPAGTNGSDATVNETNVTTVLNGVAADTLDDNSTMNFIKTTLKKITWANIKITLKSYLDGYWGNVTNREQQFFHGFVNVTDSSITDLVGTTDLIFTLTKVNNYTTYIGGVPTIHTVSKTIDLELQAAWGNGTTDPIGQWFVWLNSNGTLEASKTAWTITDISVTPIATVHVQPHSDGTPNKWEGITSDERHDYRRNLLEHRNQHDSWGAQYVSGFTGITIGTGIAGNSTNTFSLVGGTIRDEELYHVISNPQTNARIGYKDGANNWMKFNAAGTGYAILNGTAPRYDASGTLTDIPTTSGGRYGIYWVYGTNRVNSKIAIIVGQNFYTSVSLAQAAALPTLYGFQVAEWKLLYRVIVRNVSGTVNWIQSDALYLTQTGLVVSAGSVTTLTAGNVSYVAGGNIIATNVQSAIEELDSEKQASLTFGIANTNAVRIDSADAASGEYTKLTANGIESKSFSEVRSDLNIIQSKSFVITNPTANSDLPIWRVPNNITITAVHALTPVGVIVGHLYEYDANGLNGSSVDGTDITTTAATNTNDDGSLNNATIAANNYLGWKTTSVSSSPTYAIVTFEYI